MILLISALLLGEDASNCRASISFVPNKNKMGLRQKTTTLEFRDSWATNLGALNFKKIGVF